MKSIFKSTYLHCAILYSWEGKPCWMQPGSFAGLKHHNELWAYTGNQSISCGDIFLRYCSLLAVASVGTVTLHGADGRAGVVSERQKVNYLLLRTNLLQSSLRKSLLLILAPLTIQIQATTGKRNLFQTGWLADSLETPPQKKMICCIFVTVLGCNPNGTLFTI